jgi:glycerol-3-phosphate dehydrogenase
MAIDAVDHAARVGGLPGRLPVTAELTIHGGEVGGESREDGFSVYGSDSPGLRSLCAERPEWDCPLHPALPYRRVEVVWAARHEAARSVEDVLARRTRALFLDARASMEAAPQVAVLLTAELERDLAWQDHQVENFCALAQGYLVPAG